MYIRSASSPSTVLWHSTQYSHLVIVLYYLIPFYSFTILSIIWHVSTVRQYENESRHSTQHIRLCIHFSQKQWIIFEI